MDAVAQKFLEMAYGAQNQQEFNDGFNALLGTEQLTKVAIPLRLKKELASNKDAYPKDSTGALRFLTYFPLPMFRESPIFNGFLQVLTPADQKKIPTPTTVWGDQKFLKADVEDEPQSVLNLFTSAIQDSYYSVLSEIPEGIVKLQNQKLWRGMDRESWSPETGDYHHSEWQMWADTKDLAERFAKGPSGQGWLLEMDYTGQAVSCNALYELAKKEFEERVASGERLDNEKLAALKLYKGEWGSFILPPETYTPVANDGYLVTVKAEAMVEAVTAGMLDFPRKKLPASVWLYEPENPLPRLQPKLRSTIISEARYRLSKFGAKLKGIMLYGGAATYQYHEGGDIDCSCYIDWDSFKGDEEILDDAFKSVEIPWDKYVVHLFVKPSNQQEQIEVADAYYDVMRDEWELPPLVLPKDFDPEVFFKPMVEMAEKKAQKMDLMMGEVSREWSRLKKCLRALKEGARDEEAVREKAEVVRSVLLDKIDVLCEDFVKIWKNRKKLHDQLREKYINDRNIGRFERFQYPEVVWKYLDEMGYVEFLKVLAKANEEGVIRDLIESATPQLPDNLPEVEEGPDEIEPD